ncbi:hypothetical protein HK104_001880 [Borealophlyctis nickersoniae]|nr:hypothetical protein HK104_001880 [Borealophlyctis nickersoniae]
MRTQSSPPARTSRLFLSAIVASSLCAPALAFDGTAPLIIWSGRRFDASSPPTVLRHENLHTVIDNVGCPHVNVVFNQLDLHASDLPRLSSSLENLRSSVNDAKSSIQIPYLANAASAPSSVVQSLKAVCKEAGQTDIVVAKIGADGSLPKIVPGRHYILKATFKRFREAGIGNGEEDAMANSDRFVGKVMSEVDAITKDWAAFYTSTGPFKPAAMHRRAEPSGSAQQIFTDPYSKRSLFQKYVFFSDGLFMCIASTIPLVIIGIIGVRVLMSVQSPTRFEQPKKEK